MAEINPEVTKLQETQKGLIAEIETLNGQAMQKRELLLKYQGVVEYLSAREPEEVEDE